MSADDYALGAHAAAAAVSAMANDLPMSVHVNYCDVEIVNGTVRAVLSVTWGPISSLRSLLKAFDESPTIKESPYNDTLFVLAWAHPRGTYRAVVNASDMAAAGLLVAS